MFAFTNAPNTEALDARIAELIEEMAALTGNDEDYCTMTDNLAKLMKLRNDISKLESEYDVEQDKIANEKDKLKIEKDKIYLEKEKSDLEGDKIRLDTNKFAYEKEKDLSWKPSPDAIVTAAASIVGILFVLHYEKLGVVTSKALGFVGKLKN